MSNSSLILEVCVDSIESALAAEAGGADRLEICNNLGVGGGTTPSIGLVKLIRRRCPDVPLMALVRPRTGDFLYSQDEMDVMLEDIAIFAAAGVLGVVFGVLASDGSVDKIKTKRLAEKAKMYNLEACFHRAFDMVNDADKAFVDISSISFETPITRILTSGGTSSVLKGLDNLRSLARKAHTSHASTDSGMAILPGGGIKTSNMTEIFAVLFPAGVHEFHMSGGAWEEGEMLHRPEGMGMGAPSNEWSIWKTREETVRMVRTALDKLVPHDSYQ
ncbi:hypothetical protein BD410DRAFT_790329 [Rickenella mellea]|uniref:Copper homeostasis protein cutC homolog n=1 Tax=Rickenella mellea TaxID=50990 RepID=A0A4Y7Q0W4_9AGAM|nr:hypothetical protein BD410DRAFT_790329 [Rickenella mellea]